ncbi:MAG: hypothetical protein E6G78_04705 [Alphaproteobacteria bacterium]|nr:MAG: hypothetical protein E6G78_04705 [Alphaproteobacteria bacterium]TMK00605.1 MAG: hypothetical protein E6G77_10405 [Alphaproteobacteria bacterium]
MNRIERVVVDECVGQESHSWGSSASAWGEQPVKFVFLATEHPGIPDIEILDKLLDVRSALVLVVYLALLRWGFLFGCAPEEACVVLGAAVVVLAPEKYNSIAQWPC